MQNKLTSMIDSSNNDVVSNDLVLNTRSGMIKALFLYFPPNASVVINSEANESFKFTATFIVEVRLNISMQTIKMNLVLYISVVFSCVSSGATLSKYEASQSKQVFCI